MTNGTTPRHSPGWGMRNRNSIPICIIFLLVLVLVFPVRDGNDADVRSLTNIPGLRTGTTHERGPDGLPNSFVEEFTDLKNIDFSNTSCGVDPILGLVSFDSASAVTPSYLGTASMDTRSHGGGFSPKYNEYWYPYWSGSTIYRYNRNYGSTGTFDSGQNEMMQVWGDLDGTYYTANWGQSIITKRTDRGSGTVWVYNIGSTAAAVCCDHRYVYAMVWGDSVIHVLDKENGRLVRQLNLPGWIHSYGGMAAANGKLYIGGYSNYGYSNSNYRGVNIHDAVTGAYEGGFYVDNNIYSMAFNGEEYCISPNSGTIWRYGISDGNAYYGGTADGDDCTRYVQSGVLHSGEVVGAVRLNATHSTPGGCSITYNVTADGRHWETVLPGETHVMVHPGPHLLWNATLVSPDLVDTPTIDRKRVGIPSPAAASGTSSGPSPCPDDVDHRRHLPYKSGFPLSGVSTGAPEPADVHGVQVREMRFGEPPGGGRLQRRRHLLGVRGGDAAPPLSAAIPGSVILYHGVSRSRRTASSTSPRCPKALKRRKCSPAGPKPEPGVVTMCFSSSSSPKASHEVLSEKRTQMYGEFTPP